MSGVLKVKVGGVWVEIPAGPPGPPGPAGTGSAFRFVQPTPSVTWTIDHGLGYYPNVTTVDSTGREIIGEIDYASMSQVICTFSATVAGEAYLS